MHRANSLRVFLRRFVVALVTVSVISGGVMAAANVIENQKLSNINRIKLPDNILSPTKPGAPANYLIIGSDSRQFVETPAEAAAFGPKGTSSGLSDVMMVVHVVPELGTAFVVSFPRDTYVAIPGHGHGKLNAAYAYGGPALTIQTFKQDFGIPIQHYLAVDFIGFEKIVDAIGHVKIYFPTPARDFYTGLYQPVAGCASLNGVEALSYARSRHYAIPVQGIGTPNPQSRSDWNEDPLADLDRIKRQQYFLRSLGQTALNHGASNLLTAYKLLGAVTSSLTGDKSLTNSNLKSLVRTFRGLEPASVEMTTVPVTTENGQLVVQYPQAQALLDRLKDFSLPNSFTLAAKPSSVRVVVVDASGVSGRAAKVDAAFTAHGFKTGGFGGAAQTDYAKTQVRYGPGGGAKGLAVALAIGTSNAVEVESTTAQLGSQKLSGDVIVVIGRDYPTLHGALSQPVPNTGTTKPTTAATGAVSTSSSTSTSTTTTTVATSDTRYVPTSRKGHRPLVGCP